MNIELAWAAGFFDGEGSCHLHRTNAGRSCYLRLSLKQVAGDETLERFKAAVGGGRLYGPYDDPRPNARPRCEWSACGKEADRIASLLYPELCSTKRAKIDFVRGQVSDGFT